MRKIAFITALVMASFLLTFAFSAAAAGPRAQALPAAAAVPAIPAVAAMPQRHPHILEGLEAMRNAKHHLEAAVGDFHGHRARAIQHLDQAIHEAEICEQEP
jgi:Spy/CpxP family protein refolding chaperone